VSRSVLQRAAQHDKLYVLRSGIVGVGIEEAMGGEHPLYPDILAHHLSDVVVGRHKTAAWVQAKSGGELHGERGKMVDVGLEVRDGKDDVFRNEFLSVDRESEGE
jgi:hypothetical protein